MNVVKKARNLLAVSAMTSAAALGFALPATASVPGPAPAITSPHVMFAVVDNGGVLVTRQPLTVHQVVYTGGIAETVQSVRGTVFTVTPALPVSDRGKTVVFST